MGVGRLLNLDRLAARFNRWIGPTAIADKAAPGDARSAHDVGAVAGVLGEIERGYGETAAGDEDEDMPPLNLEALEQEKRERRG